MLTSLDYFPFYFYCCCLLCPDSARVDRVFSPEYSSVLRGKRIGLITNHTAINADKQSTISLFKARAKDYHYELRALLLLSMV